MKKIMLVVALAAITLTADAQGYIGGGLTFGAYTPGKLDQKGSSDPETQTTFGILPEIGYTLDSNWSLGLQFGFIHKGNYNGVEDQTSNSFTFAPYARYTVVRLGRVGLFVDGQIQYSTSKVARDDADDSSSSSFSIGVRPGLSVALNEKFSIVTKIAWFGYSSSKSEGYTASSNFSLNANGGGNSLGNLTFALYYNF